MKLLLVTTLGTPVKLDSVANILLVYIFQFKQGKLTFTPPD